MSRASLTASKLSSPSGEIRHRALLNLLAKANSKLIAPSALARLVVTPGGGGGRVDGGGATGEAAAAAAPATAEEESKASSLEVAPSLSLPMQIVTILTSSACASASASPPSSAVDLFLSSDVDSFLHLLYLIVSDPFSPLGLTRPSLRKLFEEGGEDLKKREFYGKILEEVERGGGGGGG
ncbi:hypothetical protein ScalyP_jg6776, partial [Parmales sp. scaly parma]